MDGSRRVLITGGTGFIGTNLVHFLGERGFDAINVSKKRVNPEAAVNVAEDLTTSDLRFLKELDYEYAVLLAGNSSPARSQNYAETIRINSGSVERVLSNLPAERIKRVIFFSSVTVYEESEKNLTEESSTREEGNEPYSTSKLLAERTCSRFIGDGLPLQVFRLSNSYGPGQQFAEHEHPTVVPDLIMQALKTGQIGLRDPAKVRDYIHIKDVCAAVFSGFSSDYSGILNIGTGIRTQGRDLAEIISQHTGASIVYGLPNAEGSKGLVLDTTRASKYLKWSPQLNLDKGIEETVKFYRGQIQR